MKTNIVNSEQTPLTYEINSRLAKKTTKKGYNKELGTLKAFRAIFPDSETVFLKIYDARRINAGDKCGCGVSMSTYYKRIPNTFKFRCRFCRVIKSPLALTPLEKSHVPLIEILEITYLFFQHKQGIPAAKLARVYGYKYKTALNLAHRIMIWMGLVVGEYKFKDTKCEVDEVFCRIPSKLGSGIKTSQGLRRERTQPVLTIVEKGGKVKAKKIYEAEQEFIYPYLEENISTTCEIQTDGSPIYDSLNKKLGYIHTTCNHSANDKYKWVGETGASTNTAEAFHHILKGQLGTIHKGVSSKHIQKYIDSICWRFSNRNNDVYTALDSLFSVLPSLAA